METEDRNWYVAITEFFGKVHYSLIGAGASSYKNFSQVAEQSGIKIVAERFDVNDKTVNRITGFDENGNKTNRLPLKELITQINLGKITDPQKALDEICSN